MVQFAPERKPHWGASLGSLLGSTLSGLAQHKTDQHQRRELEKAYQQEGATAEQAKGRALLGLKGYQDFAKQTQLAPHEEGGQQPQPNGNNELIQLLQQLASQQQSGQSNQSKFEAPYQPNTQNVLRALGGGFGGNSGSQITQPQQMEQPQQGNDAIQQLLQHLQSQQPSSQPEPVQNKPKMVGPNYKKNPIDEYHKEIIDLKKQDLDIKKQEAIEKIERPKLENDYKAYKDKQEVDQILNEMDQNINSGELPSATAVSLVEGIEKNGILGIPGTKFDFNSWLGSTHERQKKLGNQLVSKITEKQKGITGGRITDLALKNIIGQVPRGIQSLEGQKLVSQDLKDLYNTEIAPIKYEEKQRILEETGGIYPRNLDQLAEKRARVIRDQRVAEINAKHGGSETLNSLPSASKEEVGTQFRASDGKIYEVGKDHKYFIVKGK